MRQRYIVAYDVSDPKRLREIFKKMRGFGDPVQYSVFQCDLSTVEKILMISEVSKIINHSVDQVIIIDIGPAEGRGDHCIEVMGCSKPPRERHAVVV
ncbi:MAG: CRISPR-associated endonuclease Cas2 [Armatimonadetes bacterium]|nr:CRISPR-associated endonuclease Cas2 [Armatimonadota bacterium]